MNYVGIDLSGPSNPGATALAAFAVRSGGLAWTGGLRGADDRELVRFLVDLESRTPVVVGIDAPLSYNVGGGDRPGDARLRAHTVAARLPSGSVMTPTMTRMVYLTLRGIALSRILETAGIEGLRLVEVHPAAAMALRGAPLDAVLGMKKSSHSRERLLAWLEAQGLAGVSGISGPTDHDVAACAAALAAWRWSAGGAVWIEKADPPFHSYDFAC
jgi:predicted nuclease with RNAse H fold